MTLAVFKIPIVPWAGGKSGLQVQRREMQLGCQGCAWEAGGTHQNGTRSNCWGDTLNHRQINVKLEGKIKSQTSHKLTTAAPHLIPHIHSLLPQLPSSPPSSQNNLPHFSSSQSCTIDCGADSATHSTPAAPSFLPYARVPQNFIESRNLPTPITKSGYAIPNESPLSYPSRIPS